MQARLKKLFSIFLLEENSPEMFCLRNTNLFDSLFKVLHKTVSDSRRICVRKSGSMSLLVGKIVPQNKEAHHEVCICL